MPLERRREIKALLDDNNLAASSLLPAPGGGPGANPASPIAEERQWTKEHYKEVIDLAADLGAERVLYIAGWQIFGTSHFDAWNWSLETLVDVAQHAQTQGVTLCIEPTSADSNLVDTADHALQMMSQSEQSNIKVMFDTFHVLYRNEDPSDYVYKMGKHLAHIHISDHDRLAPGSGGMDFRPVMEALIATGYDGFVTMEIGFTSRAVHPDSLARQALEHLQALEANISLQKGSE
jgi:protein FrlC